MTSLSSIKVADFLGVRMIAAPLSDRTLFCGDNGAGKSSLQNAIRLAVCGTFTRVGKLTKKDYPQVIHAGAKTASITVTQAEGPAFTATIASDGTLKTQSSAAAEVLDHLLDATRFSSSEIGARRTLLLSLSRQQLSDADIVRLMVERGATEEDAKIVLQVARAGWDAAESWCHEKAKVEKSDWKKCTGEMWGSNKSEGFVVSADAVLESCKQRLIPLARAEKEVETLTHAMAALNQQIQQLHGSMAIAAASATCPKCGEHFRIGTDKAIAGHAVALADLEAKRQSMSERLSALASQHAAANAIRAEMAEAVERAADATRLAATHHRLVVRWNLLKSICSPDGVPRHLIDGIVREINKQLESMSAEWSSFGPVTLHDDMMLRMGGRPYPLLSESEQWVTDACMAAALAVVSGQNVLMLDRMDVLSPANRIDYIAFANKLAAQGVQTIAFATLKSQPEIPNFTTYWISGGMLAS